MLRTRQILQGNGSEEAESLNVLIVLATVTRSHSDLLCSGTIQSASTRIEPLTNVIDLP